MLEKTPLQYHQCINNGGIDIYRILILYEANNPALQDAIKKLLCCGNKADAEFINDCNEAIKLIKRAISLIEEDRPF